MPFLPFISMTTIHVLRYHSLDFQEIKPLPAIDIGEVVGGGGVGLLTLVCGGR